MPNQVLPALTGFDVATKYHGPGYSTGSRISATLKRDSQTTWRCYVSYDHRLTPQANHAAAVNKLIDRYWPEPAPFTEEWTDWQLTRPRIVTCAGNDPDVYHWTCVGAWQFNCGAAWLIQQREALNLPVSPVKEAAS